MIEHDIEMADECRAFLQSDLGKGLDASTQQEIEVCKDELLNLDPFKYTTLTDLQNAISGVQYRANIAASVRNYLAEILVIGNQAEQIDGEE